MNDRRLPQGFLFLGLGLAMLIWDWRVRRDPSSFMPSHVLAIIVAPVLCLWGIGMLFGRGAPPRGVDAWTTPLMLFGVLLGVVNAYFLGVWRLVHLEGLWQFAPLLFVAGLLCGVMVVRKRRRQVHGDD
jgi:hypothetical protein